MMDTRSEANASVDRAKRYSQIIECLSENPNQTAKEIAVQMMRKGYIPTSERNFTAPRLTELQRMKVVEITGKKRCFYTGKMVSAYSLMDQED